MLNHTHRFAGKYTESERLETINYFNKQLSKVDLTDVTEDEHEFMMQMMLTMYANPLKNKLKTLLGGME